MKDKNLLLWILGIVVLFSLFSGFGLFGFGGGYGGMMGNYGFSGMWLFGWLFMALIFTALILFIVWLIKELQGKR